jgi:glycosyltransferase involved in cell wall biosynthesis
MSRRRSLFIQFTDPAGYAAIEHACHLLADRSWSVVLLGTGTVPDHGLKMSWRPDIQLEKISLYKQSWIQKMQYCYFALWAFLWTMCWRPKWIYASDPLCAPIAWLLMKLTKVQVVYHEHDSPLMHFEQSQFMKIIDSFRDKIGREADLCVFPQQVRLAEFIKRSRRTGPTFCVWNCPRVNEIPEKTSKENGKLILYYHGSITRSRLPISLVVAASRFKGAICLRVIGYETSGSVGYTRELARVAMESGMEDLVEFYGPVSRNRLFCSAAGGDVGISLVPSRSEDVNMQHMVGASNKPFDYMACGLPLLVTDLPAWTSTFVSPGYARACDPEDADSIEAELAWYLGHPDERRGMGQRAKEQIRQEWNYDIMFSNVLAKLELT